MFDWLFKPSCPCDLAAKAWVERRLLWLAEEFDDHAFNGRRLVLPTPEFFPDKHEPTEKCVRRLLDRVCGYMDIDPDRVELKVESRFGKVWLVDESGTYLGQPVGTCEAGWGKSLIMLDSAGFDDPVGLIGTMAHELAHVHLMGEELFTGGEYDNELTTDLTVVHFGLGLFLANQERGLENAHGKWPGTGLLKPEYMTAPMFGWALAHLAWFRGEAWPAWAKYLASGPRANLKQGLRYLTATADTRYKPQRLRS